jgi:hypothetical protein
MTSWPAFLSFFYFDVISSVSFYFSRFSLLSSPPFSVLPLDSLQSVSSSSGSPSSSKLSVLLAAPVMPRSLSTRSAHSPFSITSSSILPCSIISSMILSATIASSITIAIAILPSLLLFCYRYCYHYPYHYSYRYSYRFSLLPLLLLRSTCRFACVAQLSRSVVNSSV